MHLKIWRDRKILGIVKEDRVMLHLEKRMNPEIALTKAEINWIR